MNGIEAETARMNGALKRALAANEARRGAVDGDGDGVHTIALPKQSLVYFARENAIRALEVLKLLGAHGKMTSMMEERK